MGVSLHKNNICLMHLKVSKVLSSYQHLVCISSGLHGRSQSLVHKYLTPDPLVHIRLQVAQVIHVTIATKWSEKGLDHRVQ